jgi:glyoxylate reductase
VRPRILVQAAVPVDLRALVGDVEVVKDRAEIARADAMVTLLTERVDAAVLDAAPRLRIVANFAVGYDNVDVAAATARGVCVSNTPDVLTEATADLAFALALAAARRLGEGERMVRAGRWRGWAPDQLLGVDVWGRVLGIVGMGRIGEAMARRGRGFGMEVIATTRASSAAEVDALFARADVVSLHCPLTPATRGMVDARRLALMKPTAVLVNTARGPLIDEAALAAALAAGRLAGAGLDVFAEEPAIHPALLAEERVVLAPHIGSATTTARTRMGELCASAVRAVLRGEAPPNLVDPSVWPRRRFVGEPLL